LQRTRKRIPTTKNVKVNFLVPPATQKIRQRTDAISVTLRICRRLVRVLGRNASPLVLGDRKELVGRTKPKDRANDRDMSSLTLLKGLEH